MILLDTYIVVWLAINPSHISQAAAIAIRNARARGNGLAISSLTLFEIAQLIARGRIQTPSRSMCLYNE